MTARSSRRADTSRVPSRGRRPERGESEPAARGRALADLHRCPVCSRAVEVDRRGNLRSHRPQSYRHADVHGLCVAGGSASAGALIADRNHDDRRTTP